MNTPRLPILIIILCSVVFVGYRHHQHNSYGKYVEKNFVAGCTAGTGPSMAPTCECIYDKIEATIPFDQFKAVDEKMRRNIADIPPWLPPIIKSCAATAVPAQQT